MREHRYQFMRTSVTSTSQTPPTTLLHRTTLLAPILACGGLVLLTVAQSQLQNQLLTLVSLGALVLGLFAWLIALRAAPPTPDVLDELVTQQRTIRWPLLGVAGALIGLSWIGSGSGVYTLFGVCAWIAATLVWCLAWWPTGTARSESRSSRLPIAFWLALAVILATGAFFRFYRLAEVPADPTSDHAEKLLDIYDLVSGQRPLFFPRNTGREPGQFYITYGLMRLFGLPLSFETLKLGTALIGLLAIPAVFLFGRELAGNTVGLIAATGFAISKWVVNTARMGLRFPYGPLPTAIVLWLLFRYLRRGDRRDALWCGLAIGLGLHGYISFRIVPLLVPLLFGWALLTDRRWRGSWRRLLADSALITVTAIVTCLPLIHYTVQHPDQVWYRVATRAANAEQEIGGLQHSLATFLLNNRNALLAFNWRGDDTVVNAVHHDPFLDLVTGGALLAGLLIVGYQLARRAPRYSALAIATPVLMLPSTLNLAFPVENPSANRMGTVAPVIFVIVALPLAYAARQLWTITQDGSRPQTALRRASAVALLLGAFGLSAQHNYTRYFHDYDLQYRGIVQNTHEVVQHIRQMQQRGVALDHVYMLAFPHWLDGRNLALMLGDPGWQPTHDLPDERDLPERPASQQMLFVLHPDDLERKQQLEASYPDGIYTLIQATPPGKNFAMYLVPSR
ncbi:MAG TPA: glycosyltransferase family 39 protein [Herpetosiphonaceae bacterium]